MARSKTFDLESDHEERYYTQNKKTVGDKWAEGSDEWGVLRQGSDDGDKDVSHKLSRLVEDKSGWDFNSEFWQPGPINGVGDNARPKPTGDAGTKSPRAASPSGKYGKPGGSGQRSGS